MSVTYSTSRVHDIRIAYSDIYAKFQNDQIYVKWYTIQFLSVLISVNWQQI